MDSIKKTMNNDGLESFINHPVAKRVLKKVIWEVSEIAGLTSRKNFMDHLVYRIGLKINEMKKHPLGYEKFDGSITIDALEGIKNYIISKHYYLQSIYL